MTSIYIPTKSIDRRKCEVRFEDYKQGKRLGLGEYGEVFELCNTKGCPYVIKIQPFYKFQNQKDVIKRFTQEVRLQQYANDEAKIAPRIYDAWICKSDNKHIVGFGYIVMDKVDGNLEQYGKTNLLTPQDNQTILDNVRSLILTLHAIGIEHRDIGPGNVFFKKVGNSMRFMLGDFGLARPIGSSSPKNFKGHDDLRKGVKRIAKFLANPEDW